MSAKKDSQYTRLKWYGKTKTTVIHTEGSNLYSYLYVSRAAMNLTIASYRIPAEAAIWLMSLCALAVIGPEAHGHATLCIPTLLGLDGCIGCGLGHSVGLALRGDFVGSLSAHWMGIPATGLLLYRSITLIIRSNSNY